jgi:hypothetical protein
MKLIDGSELQPRKQRLVRIGNMDIRVIHVNVTDAEAIGRLVMSLWRQLDNIVL